MTTPHRGGMPPVPEEQRRDTVWSFGLSAEEARLATILMEEEGADGRSEWLRAPLLDRLHERFGYVDVTRRPAVKRKSSSEGEKT